MPGRRPASNCLTAKRAFYCAALLGVVLAVAGCGRSDSPSPANPPGPVQGQVIQGQVTKAPSLVEARQGFKTVVRPASGEKEPVPEPPPEVFTKVTYESLYSKLVNRRLAIGLAGLQEHRREVRLVDGVGIVLGFETEGVVLLVHRPA